MTWEASFSRSIDRKAYFFNWLLTVLISWKYTLSQYTVLAPVLKLCIKWRANAISFLKLDRHRNFTDRNCWNQPELRRIFETTSKCKRNYWQQQVPHRFIIGCWVFLKTRLLAVSYPGSMSKFVIWCRSSCFSKISAFCISLNYDFLHNFPVSSKIYDQHCRMILQQHSKTLGTHQNKTWCQYTFLRRQYRMLHLRFVLFNHWLIETENTYNTLYLFRENVNYNPYITYFCHMATNSFCWRKIMFKILYTNLNFHPV